VRVLSCDEIRAEVERGLDILAITAPGGPSRHRSMRVIFDASWRLLSPAEQQAAARLAVMRSPFDRHTAAAVAEVDAVVLRALLDKSMLARSGGRFLMLEVMRQYALERLALDAQDETRTRARHVRVFTDLLQRLAPATARCEPDALTLVDDGIDEIRAAWLFAVRAKDAASLLRAVDTLFHFYDARGWIREALDTFGSAARVFDATGTDVPGDDDARVRASLAARLDVRRGVLHSRMGELDRAEALLLHGAAAARGLGDSREVVFALNRLGANRLLTGRYDDAAAAHREARELAEAAGDRHATGWSLTHLGNLAWTRGEYDAATRYYTEALEILREHQDRSGMWTAVNNLGAIAYVQKDYEQARRRFSEGVTLQRELRNQRSTAMLLHNLGCVDMAAGDHDSARGHLLQALAISERMGYQRMSALSLLGLADLSLREGDLDGAGTALKRALQLAAAANSQPVSLEALLGMARLRARQGDGTGAAQLARIVVHHPASEQDARAKARQLLEEVASMDDAGTNTAAGGPPVLEHAESDLEQLIASLLEREPAPVDT
jgi:tetratricopeptide (TPR) repeat protein